MYRKLTIPDFTAPKTTPLNWDNWRGGWNNLLRETELNKNEMPQATNLMLKGLGVPTKRWGTEDYYLASPTGYGRGLFAAKNRTGDIHLLSITDWGLLTKKSGTSYTVITGASWASGYNVNGVEFSNNVYFVNGQREFVRYNFTNLVGFSTLASPGGLFATNISGATGQKIVSYTVTAVSQVGETLGSTAFSLATLPQLLAHTLVYVQWSPVSAASGVLVGYNIYRGDPGDETWLATTDNTVTNFYDYGNDAAILQQTPDADTTGGPIAKYIARYQDRLILAGVPNNPTQVLVSGRYPQHERFDFGGGGGNILISPDDGEDITGLAVINDKIIVTKEHSVYELKLNTTDIGNFTLLTPSFQLLTASQGCSSSRSIKAVDNDVFFANRDGVYILGYEPNILNVLRTNELSAKIRTFFDSLTYEDIQNSSAEYYDRKYILTFPVSKKSIIFDRERSCFMGPWNTPFGINQLVKYVDDTGTTRLVGVDSTDNYVSLFNPNASDDKGTAFSTIFKSKREQFGEWQLFKTIDDMFLQLRNVTGNVKVNILLEGRDGVLATEKSLTITGSALLGTTGWGTDLWGNPKWGETKNLPGNTTGELPKRTVLSKDFRTFQVEVLTTASVDNYELLGIKTTVRPQGPGSVPYIWNA